jgi:DNA replication protein DnaC
MRFRSRVEPELIDYWKDKGWHVPRYFSDDQLDILEQNPEYRSMKTACVVCDGAGTYKYLGEKYVCPDDAYGHAIMRLVKLYWLHNIPLQYQQLSWDEWPVYTDSYIEAKETIDNYISNFSYYRMNGVGLTIHSVGLGTGKTWAATYVLKQLVKMGYDGWFVPFAEVKNYFEIEDYHKREFLIGRVRESSILVLDEVQKPWSEPSKRFYADRLEELIRPRTNSNLPTIITTNMTMEELEDIYPRVFSLLMMKNIQIELSGSDARINDSVWRRQVETSMNGERLPID